MFYHSILQILQESNARLFNEKRTILQIVSDLKICYCILNIKCFMLSTGQKHTLFIKCARFTSEVPLLIFEFRLMKNIKSKSIHSKLILRFFSSPKRKYLLDKFVRVHDVIVLYIYPDVIRFRCFENICGYAYANIYLV